MACSVCDLRQSIGHRETLGAENDQRKVTIENHQRRVNSRAAPSVEASAIAVRHAVRCAAMNSSTAPF
jgi:hypothetical protein